MSTIFLLLILLLLLIAPRPVSIRLIPTILLLIAVLGGDV